MTSAVLMVMMQFERQLLVLKYIAVTIIVMLSASSSHALRCFSLVGGALPVRTAQITMAASKDTFVIRDRLNPNLVEFAAHLNSITRELSISAYLSFPKEGFRSSISGTASYHQMMTHFGVQNIDSIAGRWLDGDNKDAYFKNLAAGMSKEAAALNTWSGKMASGYGFTKAFSVSEERHSITGQVTVKVIFVRP